MGRINPSSKDGTGCIDRQGRRTNSLCVVYRLIAATFLALLIISCTNLIMLKPHLVTLATVLAPLQLGSCSPEPEVPQSKLPAFESNGKLWPSQKYKTETFEAPDMLVNKTGQTENGYLFIEPWGNGITALGPTIMTEDNDLIWHGFTGDATNLKVQSLEGKPVLTYWKGTSTATFGHGYGAVSILDDTYTEIGRVCGDKLDFVTPSHEKYDCYLDMHESYLTDNGTLIFTAYNVTKYDLRPVGGPKNGWIFDSQFYEVDYKTSEVLFRWSSLEHMDEIPLNSTFQPVEFKGTKYGYKQSAPLDYFHINSVQPLRDGWLVDGRQTFSVYKVNRKGNVEWQLQGLDGGDFDKPKDLRFSWQHDPRVASYRSGKMKIHLFNNDNSQYDTGKHESTGVELTLDENSKLATADRRLADPADPIYADSQGSYQPLGNGHVLLGYGQIAKVKEFDVLGAVVYTAEFGASTDGLQVASYRAYRYVWNATPKADPKVVAQASGKLTNVYASWNGATDVDHWTVYAGKSKSSLKQVQTVRKSGFETVVPLTGTVKYVQVEARKGSTSLRKSDVVKVKTIKK